jgi:hypothetical protein
MANGARHEPPVNPLIHRVWIRPGRVMKNSAALNGVEQIFMRASGSASISHCGTGSGFNFRAKYKSSTFMNAAVIVH